MINNNSKIVILGAGPCGLGAAWRLNELAYDCYDLFEQNDYAGGLAASFLDNHGFTWDIGGHILFSHYDYFDRVMNFLMPANQWISHERDSWIWICNRFIPYPLQHNIGRLPTKKMFDCLIGLFECLANGSTNVHASDFLSWIYRSFGKGLADLFFIPYNQKVWAYPLEQMSADWLEDRIALPHIQKIVFNIVSGQKDSTWGPNNTFRFPHCGGTGSIWRALLNKIPESKVHLNTQLIKWSSKDKIIWFSDGTKQEYDYLISTIPLDQLLCLDDSSSVCTNASFMYSSSNIVGIGLIGTPPEELQKKCWIYFPSKENPFYRLTVFSNYSPQNVPAGLYWSLMAEIAESSFAPVDHATLVEQSIDSLLKIGCIKDSSKITSTWLYRAEHAYPTPFRGRNDILAKFLPLLQKANVYSRGRFGAWRYECGNQDHTFMQGVEAVENILFGTPELTLCHSSIANAVKIR